jgi:hypothetical protein
VAESASSPIEPGRVAEVEVEHSTPVAPQQPGCFALGRREAVAAWLLVWALFVSMSFSRAPIPAVNEPHYLGKARYWWDPTWCAGDFFLASSNPHAYFYITIGWLTKFLSLPQTAVVARVVSLGLLAAAWTSFCRGLYASRWTSVAAAAVFCLLMAGGNFSGEWLIGGVESKVLAYALALWGGAAWMRGRPVAAAALAAGTVAYHPVAGMWVIVAALLAGVWRKFCDWRGVDPSRSTQAVSEQPGRSRGPMAAAGVVLIVATIAALWPALPLVVGVDPAEAREADRILLTQRVGHHTDPMLFLPFGYWYYAGLIIAWTVTAWLTRGARNWRTWNAFVGASLVIAAVGLVVGWLPEFSRVDRLAPWRLWLLKFYPFRLADLTVPMSVALGVCRGLEVIWKPWHAVAAERTPQPFDAVVSRRGAIASVALAAAAWTGMLCVAAPDANPSSMSAEQYRIWAELLDWVRHNTPEEALIATANTDAEWGVKWFADRPEYVNFKDCPQDAAGILEWWRRRRGLVQWSRTAKADGTISAADLAQLHAETGIDYLIVSRYGPIEPPPLHSQGPFRVYRLAE